MEGGFKELSKLDDLEMAAMIIGGACHDFDHPGVNNAFLQNNRKTLAYRYND
jgi:hypothetical protein